MILWSPNSEKFFRMEVGRENVVQDWNRREISKKVEEGSKTNSPDSLNLPAGIATTGIVFKTIYLYSAIHFELETPFPFNCFYSDAKHITKFPKIDFLSTNPMSSWTKVCIKVSFKKCSVSSVSYLRSSWPRPFGNPVNSFGNFFSQCKRMKYNNRRLEL